MGQLQLEFPPRPPPVPPVYDELEELSLPFIKSYQTDLTAHDKHDLSENPNVPFLHFTGDTGTHLELLGPADSYPSAGEYVPYIFSHAERNHILNQKSAVVDAMPNLNRMDLILYFDGHRLRKIKYEKAREIVRDYQRMIRAKWKENSHAR